MGRQATATRATKPIDILEEELLCGFFGVILGYFGFDFWDFFKNICRICWDIFFNVKIYLDVFDFLNIWGYFWDIREKVKVFCLPSLCFGQVQFDSSCHERISLKSY